MGSKTKLLDTAASEHLRPSSRVLLLVDFINPMRFPGAEKLVPAALEAARATAQLKKRLTKQGTTAIYANDNYGIWRSEFRELLSACQSLPGARGEISNLLCPTKDDLTVLKPLHSAFHSTPLDHLLRQLKAKEVVVVGLSTDMCVQLTAMDAYMRNYQVWVPNDCTAAESEGFKSAALAQMSRVFKCSIRSSKSHL